MYSPHARVSHFIPAERCTLGWLTRRYAWQGLSEATRGNIDMHAHHAALLEDAREHPIYRDLLDELAREPADDRQAGQRLQFIRGLSAALLGCNGLLSTANSSLQQPAPNLKPAPHGASRLATWFSGRF